MAVDDRTRLNLHRKLESVLGTRGGRHPHGPPASHHMEDIATKDDLRVLVAELRTEFADVPAFPSGIGASDGCPSARESNRPDRNRGHQRTQ